MPEAEDGTRTTQRELRQEEVLCASAALRARVEIHTSRLEEFVAILARRRGLTTDTSGAE